ncbi:MAG: tRNA uridine(34) 5-carboxymethylaminomethyl modification radical SAM/GNAT enzyme Elp3 [Candidatus Peregrinibacteria bacterium]|nr:tRNA uridine(34) 5-carboxymethylaminomethyl modification radical SAM/GNAT enzyme Elp3 [Candidatus Peregrinibacteria bacterium]MDZ4244518.1 tRNA uridine(34) 5-carboxymethylaminomethyl modification radical SAM/GNAT enzyme Elp3 [Candidatus Gracilibacteria bacterium]
MNDKHAHLFEKEESSVYKVRTGNTSLCEAVIKALYGFVEEMDEAMLSERVFEKIRNQVTKKFQGQVPRNIELVQAYRDMIEDSRIEPSEIVLSVIIKRKVRTLSGIANITVLMKDYGCPGECIFCPTQPGMPKSYFSTQPAMMRAVRNDFNSYLQVKARLNGLYSQGHDVTKIDVRTAGGTWSSYPHDYQEDFVKGIYFALNEGRGDMLDFAEVEERLKNITLEELIKQNETAVSRCVGLFVETRPDWITIDELTKLRRFGVTGIELGIQTTDDKVNEFNKRGHGLEESVRATKLCRDVGLKICHHIMPNLPASTVESDLQTVRDLFSKGILNPDYIKIYPCMVLPYTELEGMYKKDSSIYSPYSDEELIKILTEIKKEVPEYCRIIRLLRDFPSELVLSGSKLLNVRQIMQNRGISCRCVRCREIKDDKFKFENIGLVERNYDANEGKEYFLSFEDTKEDKLIGLLRLRLLTNGLDPELAKVFPELKSSAIVRELHVYGQQKSLSNTGSADSNTQHLGYGRRLMQRAEEIAKENNFQKIAVIAAIGTREYYKKLGYSLEGTYMVKSL